MAIALPLIVSGKLVGTSFLAAVYEKFVVFATAVHHLVPGKEYGVVVPPHGGDLLRAQQYPMLESPILPLRLALVEPTLDIAVLVGDRPEVVPPAPVFVRDPASLRVGDEMIVVGYPFAPLGSLLETAQITSISALGSRRITSTLSVSELILNSVAHPGSSGSPVIRRADGIVCGVLRGSLAPPSVIAIGNIPIATDTTVTYATSSHYLIELIADVVKRTEKA